MLQLAPLAGDKMEKRRLEPRIDNRSQHPEDIYEKEPDGKVFTQEYVELGIMPPDSAGKVYRLAVNPVAGSHAATNRLPTILSHVGA